MDLAKTQQNGMPVVPKLRRRWHTETVEQSHHPYSMNLPSESHRNVHLPVRRFLSNCSRSSTVDLAVVEP